MPEAPAEHPAEPPPAEGSPAGAPTDAEARARAAVAAIWERSRGLVERQLDELEAAVLALLEGTADDDHCEAARRQAHKLAGSLGTFGFPAASRIARRLEVAFELGRTRGPESLPALADDVVALRAAIGDPAPPAPPGDSGPTGPHLLIVDADVELATRLRAEAGGRGWYAEHATGTAEALSMADARRPDAVLLDLSLADGPQAVLDLLLELGTREPPVPVAVLTAQDAFTDRVEVASLGGRAFLPKPLSPAVVIDAVAGMLRHDRAGEPVIMAVDDDPTVLAAVGAMGAAGGKQVVCVDDPSRFWDALVEIRPDLLLLDVDMPGVNGIDLCQVVRNDPRWRHLPVVFLTGDSRPETVRRLFEAGADDYVAKPVDGPELLARIDGRLERVRVAGDLSAADPLTGLPGRRRSEETMERLATMADRYRQPLAVAVVDVDGMRAINAAHGHTAGDRVLEWLAGLLRRAFRGDDVVARWGGSEFFVAMYGLSRADGVRRVAEVLEAFRAHEFPGAADGTFRTTFRAGVAQYPDDGRDPGALYRSATQAAAEAREAGGDRVRAAGAAESEPGSYDVVVVDDDEALARLLLHALGTRGLRAHWIADGQEAARSLAGPRPEVTARVILLDWNLPGLDGLRVLGRLSETGVLRDGRAIMLTARAAEPEVLLALELGAFDHVAKPFSVPVLLQRVARAMEY